MPSILIEGEDIEEMTELFYMILKEAKDKDYKLIHSCLSN